MLFAPCRAFAGPITEGLHLTWDDCFSGTAALSHAAFACNDAAGGRALVLGFRLAQPLDSLIGIEVVVDLQAAAPLPDWWRFEAGGCREGLLTADSALPTSCQNPWGTVGTALIQDYAPGAPRGGPGQARIRAVVAVIPSDSARTLSAGTDYAGMSLLLPYAKTTGLGACTGCGTDVCIVLNSVLFRRLPGGTPDVILETPGGAGAQIATWQGTTANCSAVPVRNTTWGQLKGLYR